MWKGTDNSLAAPIAVATGVLIDSDHALDLLHSLVKGNRRYLFILFHAWEYLLIGFAALIFWNSPLLLAAVLGYLGHLMSDHIVNLTHPLAYSILYRISQRFSYDRLVCPQWLGVPESELPLWAHVEPWLWRLYHKFRNRQR